MKSRTQTLLTMGLGVIRIGVGLSSLAWPQLANRSLGVRPSIAIDGGTVTRMFGIRDAVIGAATINGDPNVRTTGLRLGALADIVDVGAVLAGRRTGTVSRGGSILIGGAAAIFALVGAAVTLSDQPAVAPARSG